MVPRAKHDNETLPQKRVCLADGGGLYCPCMSDEQKDLNTFSSWDCFGAVILLSVGTGASVYAITDPHSETQAIWYCVMGGLIALVVLAVSLITRWRAIGIWLNRIALLYTFLLIGIVGYHWYVDWLEFKAKFEKGEMEQVK